tara:strand:+ start:211 stop:486 length:276 start_codon:yes stop_codon:yes gene_type:complete
MVGDPNQCIFCKVAPGVAPSFKIHEDDDALAFMDIAPFNKGHALVIPKAHYENVHDVSEDGWQQRSNPRNAPRRLSTKAISLDGINLIQPK